MRVVLDVNLLVSARLTPKGEAQAILDQADTRYDLLLSDFILEQVESVLNYPRLQTSFPHLTPEVVATYLAKLRKTGSLVIETTHVGVSPDLEDNCILAVAVNGQADYLVTRNLAHFPSNYGQVKVVSPADFHRLIRKALGRQ